MDTCPVLCLYNANRLRTLTERGVEQRPGVLGEAGRGVVVERGVAAHHGHQRDGQVRAHHVEVDEAQQTQARQYHPRWHTPCRAASLSRGSLGSQEKDFTSKRRKWCDYLVVKW